MWYYNYIVVKFTYFTRFGSKMSIIALLLGNKLAGEREGGYDTVLLLYIGNCVIALELNV